MKQCTLKASNITAIGIGKSSNILTSKNGKKYKRYQYDSPELS